MLPIAAPVVLMLAGGRTFLDQHHPKRLYNLGKAFGITCNVASIFFAVQSTVIFCFPYTMVRLLPPFRWLRRCSPLTLPTNSAGDCREYELWYVLCLKDRSASLTGPLQSRRLLEGSISSWRFFGRSTCVSGLLDPRSVLQITSWAAI